MGTFLGLERECHPIRRINEAFTWVAPGAIVIADREGVEGAVEKLHQGPGSVGPNAQATGRQQTLSKYVCLP